MKHQTTNKTVQLYELILEFCENSGIKLVFEEGDFHPGYCKVNSKPYIFIHKHFPIEQRIDEIIKGLKQADLKGIFVKPVIRDLLETDNDTLF